MALLPRIAALEMSVMARSNSPIHIESFLAGEALLENRMVIIGSTDETVIYPTGDADTQLIGITLTAAASGAYVDVCMLGPCILKVDGNTANIVVGDPIMSLSTAGLGRKATATADVTTEIIGRALQASTAANDEISVFVNVGWYATESS
jgi:hypothetical protein